MKLLESEKSQTEYKSLKKVIWKSTGISKWVELLHFYGYFKVYSDYLSNICYNARHISPPPLCSRVDVPTRGSSC